MESNIVTYTEEALIEPDFKTRISPNNSFIEFKIKGSDVENLISISRIKEQFYNEAISNLIKKSKFLQLYIQLIEEQISDEEYEAELNEKADEYFINLKEIKSEIDYTALVNIIQNRSNNFTVDEVSEIFGIKTDSLIKNLTINYGLTSGR